MSISIDSLLADAKCLVGRLKSQDGAAAAVSQQQSNLTKDLEERNLYEENLKEFNKVAGHKPRSTLVLGMQHENNAIRQLQHENEELKQSLSEHQNALELIMTKYRHQIVQFTDSRKFLQVLPSKEVFSVDEKQQLLKTQMLTEKIDEMADVMRRAAEMDEKDSQKQQDYIARLETENRGLRDLLMITDDATYGGYLVADGGEPGVDDDDEAIVNFDDTLTSAPTSSSASSDSLASKVAGKSGVDVEDGDEAGDDFTDAAAEVAAAGAES